MLLLLPLLPDFPSLLLLLPLLLEFPSLLFELIDLSILLLLPLLTDFPSLLVDPTDLSMLLLVLDFPPDFEFADLDLDSLARHFSFVSPSIR